MSEKKSVKVTKGRLVFLIKNWEKFSLDELSLKMSVDIPTIKAWAAKLRKKGVSLPKKGRSGLSVFDEVAREANRDKPARSVFDDVVESRENNQNTPR